MIRITLPVLVLAVLSATICFAQSEPTPIHVQSTTPANSRFEIVQSTIAANLTFRLDKRTGQISQLVHGSTEDLVWQPMLVIGLAQTRDPSNEGHYQIFLSGITNRFVFLIDTDSGRTWQLQSTKDSKTNEEELDWIPIG
jgi:hypothetical protein